MAYHRTRLFERWEANALKGVEGAAVYGSTSAGVNKLRCPFLGCESERKSFCAAAGFLHSTQDTQGHSTDTLQQNIAYSPNDLNIEKQACH